MKEKNKGLVAPVSFHFPSDLALGPVDQALAHFVAEHPEHITATSKIGVAYSGGADSTALLMAACRLWPDRVYSLHVHHGLQAVADDFLSHCEQQCKYLKVPLTTRHVNALHAQGESPEDAARNSRYKALAAMAQELGLHTVLLGQHADDQVETLLLALSRGAGLPGLACMPAVFERAGAQFARPILTVGAYALRLWLKEQGITWVEDPTNQSRCYTRNQIRLDVLPAIVGAFPSYQQTFARSIAHVAQAQALLEELAQQDLQAISIPPVIKALQQLTPARQANVLRYWLKQVHQTSPSAKQMDEILKQIQACQTRGHQIDLKVGHGTVARCGAILIYTPSV